MIQKTIIIIDEQSQSHLLTSIRGSLSKQGIELSYKWINPHDFVDRDNYGMQFINEEDLLNEIDTIPFANNVDVFATDFNLWDNQYFGIDVLRLFLTKYPFFNNHLVMYSAKIDKVIEKSVNGKNIEEQKRILSLLASHKIDYYQSDDEFSSRIINVIKSDPIIDLDESLADWFLSMDNKHIQFILPPDLRKESCQEIGQRLKSVDRRQNQALRKALLDQIIALFVRIIDLPK